jgi:hypothetical protein
VIPTLTGAQRKSSIHAFRIMRSFAETQLPYMSIPGPPVSCLCRSLPATRSDLVFLTEIEYVDLLLTITARSERNRVSDCRCILVNAAPILPMLEIGLEMQVVRACLIRSYMSPQFHRPLLTLKCFLFRSIISELVNVTFILIIVTSS